MWIRDRCGFESVSSAGVDAPKLSCPSVGANVADANVCVRCDVNAKPRPTSTLWVVDANGTSLAEGQVLDDYWTFSTVRQPTSVSTV